MRSGTAIQQHASPPFQQLIVATTKHPMTHGHHPAGAKNENPGRRMYQFWSCAARWTWKGARGQLRTHNQLPAQQHPSCIKAYPCCPAAAQPSLTGPLRSRPLASRADVFNDSAAERAAAAGSGARKALAAAPSLAGSPGLAERAECDKCCLQHVDKRPAPSAADHSGSPKGKQQRQ